MVTLDRIRLTGLLRRKPWKRGFFYAGGTVSQSASCCGFFGAASSRKGSRTPLRRLSQRKKWRSSVKRESSRRPRNPRETKLIGDQSASAPLRYNCEGQCFADARGTLLSLQPNVPWKRRGGVPRP